jgi:hypothetical protein
VLYREIIAVCSEISQLVLYRELIAVCSEISQSVQYREIMAVFSEISQLVLYREIIAVCSQIHTKHINTLCGLKVELPNVNLVVRIVSNHWSINCQMYPSVTDDLTM